MALIRQHIYYNIRDIDIQKKGRHRCDNKLITIYLQNQQIVYGVVLSSS